MQAAGLKQAKLQNTSEQLALTRLHGRWPEAREIEFHALPVQGQPRTGLFEPLRSSCAHAGSLTALARALRALQLRTRPDNSARAASWPLSDICPLGELPMVAGSLMTAKFRDRPMANASSWPNHDDPTASGAS
jgi:hypothetical protein